MKRSTGLVLVGAVCALGLASSASAQWVFLGGGLTIPMADFKDDAKAGWVATGGVGYDLSANVFIAGEAWYGSNKHKGTSGDKTNLLGATGVIGYNFSPASKASPYVLAGAGMLQHKYVPATGTSESETKLAVTGAAGVVIGMSDKIRLFIEGRGLTTLDSDYKTFVVPITAGVIISFGSGGGN